MCFLRIMHSIVMLVAFQHYFSVIWTSEICRLTVEVITTKRRYPEEPVSYCMYVYPLVSSARVCAAFQWSKSFASCRWSSSWRLPGSLDFFVVCHGVDLVFKLVGGILRAKEHVEIMATSVKFSRWNAALVAYVQLWCHKYVHK